MSRRWERDLPQTELGEVQEVFEHCRDFAPPGVTGEGRCGSADQWLNGCLTTDPVPPINPRNGLRTCCASQVEVGTGGEAEGGTQYVPILNCPDPAPAVLYQTWFTPVGPPQPQDQDTWIWNGASYQPLTDNIYPFGGIFYSWRLYVPTVAFPAWLLIAPPFFFPLPQEGQGCGPDWTSFWVTNAPITPTTDVVVFSTNPTYRRIPAALGGEVEGGRGWILIPPVQRGTGGEVEGGFGSAGPPRSAVGGEAEGGSGTGRKIYASSGGEAEGGTGRTPADTHGTGGEAEGGSGSP